jgi:hypothetical protein
MKRGLLMPLDVFAEFAPILDVAPSVRFDFNLAVGARIWFRPLLGLSFRIVLQGKLVNFRGA